MSEVVEFRDPGGPVDTLTVTIEREARLDDKPATGWQAVVGPDWAGGIGGFGPTPLAALRNLVNAIGECEGWKTDKGRIFLR